MITPSNRKYLVAPLVIALLGLAPLQAGTVAGTGGEGLQTTTGDAESQRRAIDVRNEDLPMIGKGVQEFGLSGFFDWTDDTTYAANFSYGWFLTDNWLFGCSLGLAGRNSEVDFSGGLSIEYNFLTGTKWVPFIGLGANWKRLDSGFAKSDAIEMAGEFGVKYFLRSNMALSLSMAGTWASDKLPGGNDFGSRLNIGLRYYF